MKRIKELRIEKKMTQAELGSYLNVGNTTVSMYEGETRQIDSLTINALCDLFGCTSDYLLGRSDFRDPVVTAEQARLLLAYDRLPIEIRKAVDGLLAPYMDKAEEKGA